MLPLTQANCIISESFLESFLIENILNKEKLRKPNLIY